MKTNTLLLALVVSAILHSCSFPHFYYAPVAQNVPLNDTSNEFSGHVAGSFGTENECLEAQAGYSFPSNIALTASYLTGGTHHYPGGIQDYSKINHFEGAIGYYKSFADICVFELYGGFGDGRQNHVFAYREYMGGLVWAWRADGKADLNYSQIFLQPDIGVKLKWFEGAFSCRLSRIDYKDFTYSATTGHITELNELKATDKMFLLEPAFTLRAGSPSIKTQVQLVFSSNLTNHDLLTEVFRINFGLHFMLGGNNHPKTGVVSSANPSLSYK
jgi:hypothetical protein